MANYSLTSGNGTAARSVSIGTSQRPAAPKKPGLFLSSTDGIEGCACYRSRFVTETMKSADPSLVFVESDGFLSLDDELLSNIRSYRVQRICTPSLLPRYRMIVEKKKRFGFSLLYDIDDILIGDDMPEYHRFRRNFVGVERTLVEYMSLADVVTVTTPQLRDYYSAKLDIAPEKFRVIPNYVYAPWGDTYVPGLAAAKMKSHGSRLRIGFCAIPFHYSLDKDMDDDISGVVDWIVRNRRKYRFVFFGGLSHRLAQYASDFEVVERVPFQMYPRKLSSLDLDLLISPLRDNMFNHCKSNIKILEAWAAGIPVLTQNLPNYAATAPDCCFDSADQLDGLIAGIFRTPNHVQGVVNENREKMKNWWLDLRNVRQWANLIMQT